MTPVTIGDQKFVKDINKGWIDSKTKQPADKGLIQLLDRLVVDEPVLKQIRTKIEIDTRVEPIAFGGQKFVYDVNRGWIDEKTKVPVPPSLQRTLSNAVPRFGKNDTGDIDLTAGFGIVGQAAQQQTKTPAKPKTGGGTIVNTRGTNINKPLVAMINQLASIDGFLKQRIENQKIIDKENINAIRESQIEATDQTDQISVIKPDAEKVDSPSSGLLALGGLVALLTLDPVQEALKGVVDGVVSAGKFLTDAVSSINKVFRFLLDSKATDPTATDASTESKPGASAPTPDAQAVTAEEKPPITSNTGDDTAVVAGTTPAAIPSTTTTNKTTPSAIGGSGSPAASRPTPTVSVSGVSKTPMTSSSPSKPAPQAISAQPPAAAGKPQPSKPAPQAVSSSVQSKPAAFASAEYFTANAGSAGTGAAGKIPKNDIVALGNYLISQGADRSKMEHPALSGRVGKHSKNSRHYRNMAIDVNFSENEAAKLDALKPQLEAAGYNVLWRTKGHNTHMHVSIGGPEGGSSQSYGDSFIGVVSDTVNLGAEKIGELFGMLGSAIVKPGIPRDNEDYSKAITAAAVKTNAEVAVTKTPKSSPTPKMPTPPNINKINGGATQNPATAADKEGVYYYLRRFGYQELSTPVKALTIA